MEQRYAFLAEIEGLSVHGTVGARDGADAVSQVRTVWPQAQGIRIRAATGKWEAGKKPSALEGEERR